jgi:hypothetical protein
MKRLGVISIFLILIYSFIKKIVSFKKTEKIFTCTQQFIPPTCTKSCAHILYFGIYKYDKRLDLSMYISSLQILLDFVIFYVAHNTKNIVIKIFIFLKYNIDYVLIYFHNFLKL